MHKHNDRNKIAGELQEHLRELGRSTPYQRDIHYFEQLVKVLADTAKRERAELQQAADQILETTEIIDLNSRVLTPAGLVQSSYEMSMQDSIVFASVLTHLDSDKPAESCFLNRNSRGFDDPFVHQELQGYRCKLLFSLDQGLGFMEAGLP